MIGRRAIKKDGRIGRLILLPADHIAADGATYNSIRSKRRAEKKRAKKIPVLVAKADPEGVL